MFPVRRFDRSTTVFIGLLVISFLFATFDVRSQGQGASSSLREGAQAVFSPLQRLGGALLSPVVGVIDGISDLAGLREENDLLQDRVRELERELADTAALRNEVAELQAILGLETPEQLNSVNARVIAAPPSEFDFVRLIDVGKSDGVLVGMPVIDENGLVGRVLNVSNSHAQIRLITDPNLTVAVRVKETNETGTVTGQGSGPLRLVMYGASEELADGFQLTTAGSRFPPGIAVGTVDAPAAAEAGFSLVTTATPAINLSKLDFVKVVTEWVPIEVVDEPVEGVEVPEEISEDEL